VTCSWPRFKSVYSVVNLLFENRNKSLLTVKPYFGPKSYRKHFCSVNLLKRRSYAIACNEFYISQKTQTIFEITSVLQTLNRPLSSFKRLIKKRSPKFLIQVPTINNRIKSNTLMFMFSVKWCKRTTDTATGGQIQPLHTLFHVLVLATFLASHKCMILKCLHTYIPSTLYPRRGSRSI
jgi:hypothetical protein